MAAVVLVNSQVLLKGCETKGYVILSAAKAEILQRVHRPVWKERSLVSKTTWVGSLECMQYYATVSAGENDYLDGESSTFVPDIKIIVGNALYTIFAYTIHIIN
ncbi:hypothetical protein PR048_023386 [Dryococelus australis]|uniref:Uncharacterized protein n=1 Tax=Dryococelus australis TaxID=614101 RepID=A0ABQ9GTX7_9NEOP|nr:hypothetical protein PR048_023386 [Dryococelus australis]